jgi:hypothetical protein
MGATLLTALPSVLASKVLSPYELYKLGFTSSSLKALVLLHHPVVDLMMHPRTVVFQTSVIPVAELVAASLNLPASSAATATASLDKLHNSMSSPPSLESSRGQWKAEVQSLWRAKGQREFTQPGGMYEQLVRSLAETMGLKEMGETTSDYSKMPIVRSHAPDSSAVHPAATRNGGGGKFKTKGGSGWEDANGKGSPARLGILTTRHCDGDCGPRGYGHPKGEINCWLPVNSKASGGNSLWVDKTPWAGEVSSMPLELCYGEVGVFYGNQCKHETRQNHTEVTRSSFDFRMVVGSLFERKYTFRKAFSESGGYYSLIYI